MPAGSRFIGGASAKEVTQCVRCRIHVSLSVIVLRDALHCPVRNRCRERRGGASEAAMICTHGMNRAIRSVQCGMDNRAVPDNRGWSQGKRLPVRFSATA